MIVFLSVCGVYFFDHFDSTIDVSNDVVEVMVDIRLCEQPSRVFLFVCLIVVFFLSMFVVVWNVTGRVPTKLVDQYGCTAQLGAVR